MSSFCRKLIQKFKKELGLKGWDIDYEISNGVKTQTIVDKAKKQAIIIINKQEVENYAELTAIVSIEIKKIID